MEINTELWYNNPYDTFAEAESRGPAEMSPAALLK